MKVLMVFGRAQARPGGKESPDLVMDGKSMAIGSCHMFEKALVDIGGSVCATLHCDDGTFVQDPDTDRKRSAAMNKKLNPDAVICGPCFNYENYGEMAARTTQTINELTDIPAFAVMSEKCGVTTDESENYVTVLKMLKKGGTELSQSLAMMCESALKLMKKEDVSEMIREHTYQ